MTRKKNYCNVFLQKQLTDFSSIDGLYDDRTFKSAPKIFHQLFTIHGLTTYNLDVRGSMHHSIIHTENPTRCNSVSKFFFI